MTLSMVVKDRMKEMGDARAKLEAKRLEVLADFGYDHVDECALAWAVNEGRCPDCGGHEIEWRDNEEEDPQMWEGTCTACGKLWTVERLEGGDVVAY